MRLSSTAWQHHGLGPGFGSSGSDVAERVQTTPARPKTVAEAVFLCDTPWAASLRLHSLLDSEPVRLGEGLDPGTVVVTAPLPARGDSPRPGDLLLAPAAYQDETGVPVLQGAFLLQVLSVVVHNSDRRFVAETALVDSGPRPSPGPGRIRM